MKYSVNTSGITDADRRAFLSRRDKDSLLPEEESRLSQFYAMPEIPLWRSFVSISSFLGLEDEGALSSV